MRDEAMSKPNLLRPRRLPAPQTLALTDFQSKNPVAADSGSDRRGSLRFRVGEDRVEGGADV